MKPRELLIIERPAAQRRGRDANGKGRKAQTADANHRAKQRVVVEKERTVPDSYPLTLNALVAGCNQKTSRDPVLNAAETDVQTAVDGLKSMLLVIEKSGGRAARYAHNIERVMNVPQQASALLAMLMLRGPQTAGELRINCERLHRFADIPAVEALLNELAERPDGALVTELPRQPGSRENRWMHLLSGAPAVQSSSAGRFSG